jgi:anti-sigma factor RsiW
MSQHVPEDLLQAFVDGEVGEQLAVHIAEHLDGCPACATRAAGLEPLAAAFAAVLDPVTPPGLAAAILARVDEPERRLPVLEIGLGAGLLGTAAFLAVGLESPLALAAQLGAVLNAFATLTRGLSTALGSFQFALVATTGAMLAGGVATLHYATGPSSTLRRIP